jgi:hypothetical protein
LTCAVFHENVEQPVGDARLESVMRLGWDLRRRLTRIWVIQQRQKTELDSAGGPPELSSCSEEIFAA